MLNLNDTDRKDRQGVTTLFILNIGRVIQAYLSAPDGSAGDKIEGELQGYRNDCLIVKVKHGSTKRSHGNVKWPFLMLDKIHFPGTVT